MKLTRLFLRGSLAAAATRGVRRRNRGPWTVLNGRLCFDGRRMQHRMADIAQVPVDGMNKQVNGSAPVDRRRRRAWYPVRRPAQVVGDNISQRQVNSGNSGRAVALELCNPAASVQAIASISLAFTASR